MRAYLVLFMHWDRNQAAGRICPMVLAEAARDGRQGPQTASKGRMGDVAALVRDSPMPQGRQQELHRNTEVYTSQPGKQGFSGVCLDTKAGHSSSRVCKVGS